MQMRAQAQVKNENKKQVGGEPTEAHVAQQ